MRRHWQKKSHSEKSETTLLSIFEPTSNLLNTYIYYFIYEYCPHDSPLSVVVLVSTGMFWVVFWARTVSPFSRGLQWEAVMTSRRLQGVNIFSRLQLGLISDWASTLFYSRDLNHSEDSSVLWIIQCRTYVYLFINLSINFIHKIKYYEILRDYLNFSELSMISRLNLIFIIVFLSLFSRSRTTRAVWTLNCF